jgi:homoserine kinase
MRKVRVFAPATIANVGPGFDVLGFALENLGDVVEAERIPERKIKIKKIIGENINLPLKAEENTAGIAALEVLKILNVKGGAELKLIKKMPSASGLGSSGASAVAGAFAINLLFGNRLKKEELIEPCLKAEGAVSGYHADNIAPSLFGGFVLIKSYEPLSVIPLGSLDMEVVIAVPNLKIKNKSKTKFARSILPDQVPLKDVVSNLGNLATIIAGIFKKDTKLLGEGIVDKIVEPVRAHLIPGFYEVKKAALASGALGCSIAGAGPSIFAIADSKERARKIGKAMKIAFLKNKVESKIYITKVDKKGVRKI